MQPEGLSGREKPILPRGVGFLVFRLWLGLVGGGVLGVACGGEGAPPPDPEREAARALGLSPGARLHRVVLGGRGSQEHVVPTWLEVRSGDAVEFVTVDHRVHVVRFLPDSLEVPQREWLDRSGQGTSPPLVYRGSRFLFRLEEAPPGAYPFLAEGHGGRMAGVILVQPGLRAGEGRR